MSFTRFLFLAHRYLGIGLGLLIVVWCLSGIVMMYVPYPALVPGDRLKALAALDAGACCVLEGEAFPADGTEITNFQIEMFAARPVLRMTSEDRNWGVISLSDGAALTALDEEQAREVAGAYGRAHNLAGTPRLLGNVDRDQWTVGRFRPDRPLFHYALGDAAGTELYVSRTGGQALQVTNAQQRFWNWLGSVPHWLYFSQLREDVRLWSHVVVWTSLFGCVLTIMGIYLGIRQLKRRASTGRLASPYRGWWWWHHIPGLIFGLVTLTFVFSGLLSMIPFGFLGGTDPGQELRRLQGPPLQWATVRAALPEVLARLPPGTVHLQSAPLNGELSVIATSREGTEIRLDASGLPHPLVAGDYEAAAARIGAGYRNVSWQMLDEEDAYYYGASKSPAPLPVVRVIVEGERNARFYFDPHLARLVRFADSDGRTFRWLFNGLHSLDFNSFFRWRPFWDLLMLVTLLGATVVSVTGTWLGIKRLTGRSRGQGFSER